MDLHLHSKLSRIVDLMTEDPKMHNIFFLISDTVTDGRLDLMSHVGVTIDLSHANMGFLKRKIQAKKAEMKEQERIRTEQEKIRNEKIMKITRAAEQSNNKAKPAQVRF